MNEPVDVTPWIDILDVSAAQGAIDFDRLAAASVASGVDRRWRAIICKVAEGESWKDQTRQANIAGARRIGMPWGAYVFIHPMMDVEKQVRNAYDAIGDTMPSIALGFDLEAADPSLSSQALVDQLRRGNDATLRWFGRACMPYSYLDFFDRRMLPAAASSPDLLELDWWWAWYGNGRPWYPAPGQMPPMPEPFRSAGMRPRLWQYSGNTKKVPNAWTAHVDGITGDVDRNVFLGTEADFLYAFLGRPRPDQLEPDAPVIHPAIDFGPNKIEIA